MISAKPRWRAMGWCLYYLYTAALLLMIWHMPTDSKGMVDRSMALFAAPLAGYLAIYSLLTGDIPGRYGQQDRLKSPLLFWFAVGAFCAATAALVVSGLIRFG